MASEGAAASVHVEPTHGHGLLRPAVWAPGALPHDGTLELLKWLALLAMVIDHSGSLIFHLEKFSWTYQTGRLALPLFAIVLGCKLARKAMGTLAVTSATAQAARADLRTVKRLFIWALISTGPYLLATGHGWPPNIFFTLGLGALACWLIDADLRRRWKLLAGLTVFLLSLGCDYFFPGVFLVLAVFLYCRKPGLRTLIWVLLCLLGLAFVNWSLWTLLVLPLAAAACLWRVPMPRIRWFFYAFYPLHLLALAALAGLPHAPAI